MGSAHSTDLSGDEVNAIEPVTKTNENENVLCVDNDLRVEKNEEMIIEDTEFPGDEEAAEKAIVTDDILLVENALRGEDNVEMNIDERQGRPKRGRKRKFPEQSRSDRKKLLNSNKRHINTKGNITKAKTFDNSFICKCSKDCTTAVPLRLRKRLFSQYWTIGSFEGRIAYLLNCVSQKPKKRSYSQTNMKNRLTTRRYTMFGIEVCQKTFTKTLQISPGRLTVALKKLSCDSFTDERGKAIGGWNRAPLSKILEIRTHISSFPKYISHYTRNQTESKFLHSTLNLELMYRLYTEKYKNCLSKSSYKKVFYEYFNLRFKVPKKDTCKKCDHYGVKILSAVGVERDIIEEWHKHHLDEAELLQKQMKSDLELSKIDIEVETLTFDMQKTLPFPKLPTNIVYYKRQLNGYNFGIHVGSTGKGIFNVWMETEGSKGTQEVGSCLRKYIMMNIAQPVKKLFLWSDSCGGQNRSIKIVLMLTHILQNHPSLETISIRFLQSGHSFMQNDTEFGDFECALKNHTKVCTVEKYMKIMKDCRIKNKFCVNRISPEDFVSVKQLEQLTTNRKKDSNNKKVSWLDTHEIIIEKSEPAILKMKKRINGDFQSVNILKKGCDINDLKNVKLNELWPEGRPLSKLKVQDLKEMLFLVPDEDKYFYAFLDNVPTGEFVDDVDDFGEGIDFDIESDDE